ncbi:UNVERIFIED_CONTAM: hypothetical protein EX528_15385 [Xanthomonas axonopodis]
MEAGLSLQRATGQGRQRQAADGDPEQVRTPRRQVSSGAARGGRNQCCGHFFVIAAARGAACFGEGQTAAGSLRAAEGRGNRAPAHALRVADVRCSIACNSPVSSAGHIVHALVQLAVRGCRLGDALMRRLRATMHGRRASDLIQSALSRRRPH